MFSTLCTFANADIGHVFVVALAVLGVHIGACVLDFSKGDLGFSVKIDARHTQDSFHGFDKLGKFFGPSPRKHRLTVYRGLQVTEAGKIAGPDP